MYNKLNEQNSDQSDQSDLCYDNSYDGNTCHVLTQAERF